MSCEIQVTEIGVCFGVAIALLRAIGYFFAPFLIRTLLDKDAPR
jgi:hypothetical protein